MKIIYKPLMKVITMLLVCTFMLIVSSCSENDETSPMDSMPSSPTTVYIIDGKVVSEDNINEGISDIQIEIVFDKPHALIDTLYTTKEGEFDWEGPVSTFGEDITFNIATTDTTGIYESNITPVSFKQDDSKQDVTWFLGEARKEILIQLKKRATN